MGDEGFRELVEGRDLVSSEGSSGKWTHLDGRVARGEEGRFSRCARFLLRL